MPQANAGHPSERLTQTHSITVDCPPARAFAPIARIGGEVGWYGCDWLWRLRGLLDRLLGGKGFHPQRDDPNCPAAGARVDCWRVELFEPDRHLRLVCEMPMPGIGRLDLQVAPAGQGSAIRLTAIFEPWGLVGLGYWYSLSLIHDWMFRTMLRRMAAAALREPSNAAAAPEDGRLPS